MMEYGAGQKKKVAFVLLAAGDSRRYHGNKLLGSFQGKAMYQYIVDQVAQLPESCLERKVLVTQYQEIAQDLQQRGYTVIENHDSHLGISHSIHLALQSLEAMDQEERVEAVCFAVCDQPWLKKETIAKLLETWEKSGKGLACLCHQGDFGNPAVFARKYWQELKELRGDVGGKRVLRKHLDDLWLCEVEDGKELVDIDVRQEME